MLNRCYRAELSKIMKGKGIYIALAVMVLFIVFYAFLSSLLFGDMGMGDIPGMPSGGDYLDYLKNLDRSEYDNVIAGLKSQIDQIESDNNTSGDRFSDKVGQYKTFIAIIEYFRDHEDVDIAHVIMPMTGLAAMADSGFNFMFSAIELVSEIAVIFGIIVLSSILAGEMRDGTLKLQLMKANSRRSILTAKWLSVFTICMCLIAVGVVISSIYSVIHFEADTSAVLYVVANVHAGVMSQGAYLTVVMLFSILMVVAMLAFSMFMCTISRYNRAAGMAIPIVVMLVGGLSAYLLQVIYLGILDFPYCLLLRQFITPLSGALPHTSLYTALPILLVYIAVFMTVSYIRFERTEV